MPILSQINGFLNWQYVIFVWLPGTDLLTKPQKNIIKVLLRGSSNTMLSNLKRKKAHVMFKLIAGCIMLSFPASIISSNITRTSYQDNYNTVASYNTANSENITTEVVFDFNVMSENMTDIGFPSHLKDAIEKMLASDEDISAEAIEAAINKLASVMKSYEKNNPGLDYPWASPDNPINKPELRAKNYGNFSYGNYNPDVNLAKR